MMKPDFTINKNFKIDVEETSNAQHTQKLITAAQNGDKAAMEKLCTAFEPLFRKEMRREIFYNGLGFEEGLSLARLKFIELVLTYNGADYEHFAGYVRAEYILRCMTPLKMFGQMKIKKAPCHKRMRQKARNLPIML